MDILKKINWKQPKYMIPLIIYFPLLFVGYFVIDLFHTEKADIPDKSLATTEYLNPELPDAKMKGDGIGNKMESMARSYGQIDDREDDNYEMMFKVVLVGDSFVGKTNIMSKYLKNEFHEDSKATVGVEFGSRQFNIEGHVVKAQIWDTAGQERYKAITSAYYKGAKGAFIVYDITRKESFENVTKWAEQLKSTADKNLTIIIVGNKTDLEDQRQVTSEEGQNKANSLESAFIETSAASGSNLDKAFEMMINEVYQKCHEEMLAEGDVEIEGGEDINLSKKPENTKKACC